jgi:hypothetical protein
MQNGPIIVLPPRGEKLPDPLVGVESNEQRGQFGSHWTPWGIPIAEYK